MTPRGTLAVLPILAFSFGFFSCDSEDMKPPENSGCQSDESCVMSPRLSCRAGTCVEPGCPAGSVYVSGGRYVRGCEGGDPDCTTSAQPAHTVTLSQGFCLAQTELKVAEYRACLSAGSCPMPTSPETLFSLRCSADLATFTETPGSNEQLPMTCLLWAEAGAACSFMNGRLPTEAEWERASRGGDGRSFPWGRAAPVYCDQGVNFAGVDCPGRPWPAVTEGRQGVMLRSPFLAFDLGGNASEWVADFYSPTAYSACSDGCTDPTGPVNAGPMNGPLRVRRGGTFLSPLSELRTYAREFHLATGPRSDLIGVRCAFTPTYK